MTNILAADTEMSRYNFHLTDLPLKAFMSSNPRKAIENQSWHGEFLEMFLRNQLNLAPIMPILTLLLAMTALSWVPPNTVMAWLVGTLGCHSI